MSANERVYLTLAEVLAIHHHQIEEYGGAHGIRDRGALEAAIFRPQIGYYNGVVEEAAALMESLVNNHPFMDGNKRVAFSAAHTFLLVNGFDLEVSPRSAYQFMIESLKQGKFRFGPILEWLSGHVREGGL